MISNLQKRIIEISYKYQSAHLNSCLTSVDIIDQIYAIKAKDEPFILSNGHAGLALYCILEKYEGKDAEKLWLKHGTHPNRDLKDGIYYSTGSLGMGISAAVGMALADRKKNVYVLTGDGEWAEGICWESLRIASENKLENLIVFVNCNGYSGLGCVDLERLEWRIGAFIKDNCPKISLVRTDYKEFPFLKGVEAHYKVLDKPTYEKIVF